MKSRLILILLSAVILSGCVSNAQNESSSSARAASMPSTLPVNLLQLDISRPLIVVEPTGSLLIYATLSFNTESNGVYIFPFAENAYELVSPDVELHRNYPFVRLHDDDRYPSLAEMPVPLTKLTSVHVIGDSDTLQHEGLSVCVRLSPGEGSLYQIQNMPINFHGPLRLQVKYSYRGVESNVVRLDNDPVYYYGTKSASENGQILDMYPVQK